MGLGKFGNLEKKLVFSSQIWNDSFKAIVFEELMHLKASYFSSFIRWFNKNSILS